MGKFLLEGSVRNEKAKKCRRHDFVPGIIYGSEIKDSIPVKFNKPDFIRYINKYGSSSSLWIKVGNEEEYVLMKQIQRDIVSNEIIHVDMQAVSKNEVIKHIIPLVFNGREQLDHKGYLLQTFNTEIELVGKVGILPDVINIDVSDKKPGDTISISDIKLDDEIRVNNELNEVVATISYNSNTKAI